MAKTIKPTKDVKTTVKSETKAKKASKPEKAPKPFEVIQPKFIDRLLNSFSISVQDESYLKPVPSMKQLPATFAILYSLRNAVTEVEKDGETKEQPLKPAEKFEQVISQIKNMQTCNNLKEFKLKNILNSKLITQKLSQQFEKEYQEFLQDYEITEDEPEKGVRRTVSVTAQYKSLDSEEIQEQKRLNLIHKQMMSLYNVFVAACEIKEEEPPKGKKNKKVKKAEPETPKEPKEKVYELDQYSEKDLTKFIESKFKTLLAEKVEKVNKKGETNIVKTPFQKNYERYQTLLESKLEEIQEYQLKQPFLKLYSQHKKEWNSNLKGYQVSIASAELLNEILKEFQRQVGTISQTYRFGIEQKIKQSQKSADVKEADDDTKKAINEEFNKQKQEAIDENINQLFDEQEYPLEIIYNIEDKKTEPKAKPEKAGKTEKKDIKAKKATKKVEAEPEEESDPEEAVEEAIAEVVEEPEEEPETKPEPKRRRHTRK